VALHHVFNAPYDKIVWDVGHQAYSHKILTGRKERFHTLRQRGGVSGFPSPEESEYDAFATGHASTSISAVLGMAKAAELAGDANRNHIAVIGDGGLTGGMAFEAFNNIAGSNVLIVLNDNGIAIDKNTGVIGDFLKNMPLEDDRVNLFENMGIRYFGPVDGHDVKGLITILNEVKTVEGPKLLHVITTKGKGFKRAEQDQTRFHAPGRFDRQTGEIINNKPGTASFPEIAGQTLVALATNNSKIVAVTPAMVTGSSLLEFQRKFPERIFDTGIAEQHAVTFSAGLAAGGMKPFCTIYSTFLQRAYDQIIHDVALQKLSVVFAVDRAGLVGEDGATHHGAFDLAFMRSIPNMVVAAPMDGTDLTAMMELAARYTEGPFSIRYSKNILPDIDKDIERPVEIGKGRMISDGEQVALITLGYAGILAREAVNLLAEESMTPAHFDMRFLKPLDEELLGAVFDKFDTVITVEDGVIKGGLADAVLEVKEKTGSDVKVVSLGIPDDFVTHGKRDELYRLCGYSPVDIAARVKEVF
jgi:1-deoxy-D-xylulose-5-phosphate synthase